MAKETTSRMPEIAGDCPFRYVASIKSHGIAPNKFNSTTNAQYEKCNVAPQCGHENVVFIESNANLPLQFGHFIVELLSRALSAISNS